jgi:hypothetical protein
MRWGRYVRVLKKVIGRKREREEGREGEVTRELRKLHIEKHRSW